MSGRVQRESVFSWFKTPLYGVLTIGSKTPYFAQRCSVRSKLVEQSVLFLVCRRLGEYLQTRETRKDLP